MKCSLRSPSFLVRNAHSYCFRLIVPKDLQQFVGKTELRYTLRTGYLGVAKRKSRFLAGQVQFIFQLLRKGFVGMVKLSKDQVQQLVVAYIKKSIEGLDGVFDQGQNENLPYHDPPSFFGYLKELDFNREDLMWGLNISEDEDKKDKSVKTGERRFVPLHPFLAQELKFLAYVEALPEKQGRVFPDLVRVGERYGHHVSLWFKTFREGCGIVAQPQRKVFHSFRHTVVNHLLDNNVPLISVAGLVGHSIPGVTMEVYKKAPPPKKVLEEAVMKLDYGIDLSHLKNSKWVGK